MTEETLGDKPTDDFAWVQSKNSSSEVYHNEEKDPFHFRFQRSDQWMPVYKWLETLKADEVIKSKDVQEWLAENPEIKRDLSSRHSRYHLVHYIKKCHMKILNKKGLHSTVKISSSKAHKTKEKKSQAMLPSSSVTKLPKGSPIYMVKRNEAFRKYQILTEMEKKLSAMFQNKETAKVVTGP